MTINGESNIQEANNNNRIMTTIEIDSNIRTKIRIDAEAKFESVEKELLILRKELVQKQNIFTQRKYEELNPYINALDLHLNYSLDIIRICTSYLPLDYCVKCNSMFPKHFRCLDCVPYISHSKFHYNLIGSFILKYIDCRNGYKYVMELFHENDILFFDYLSKYNNIKIENDKKYYIVSTFRCDSDLTHHSVPDFDIINNFEKDMNRKIKCDIYIYEYININIHIESNFVS